MDVDDDIVTVDDSESPSKSITPGHILFSASLLSLLYSFPYASLRSPRGAVGDTSLPEVAYPLGCLGYPFWSRACRNQDPVDIVGFGHSV